MPLGLSFLIRFNNRREIKHTHTRMKKKDTEEQIRTANTQGELRKQLERGLWGSAAQVQTPTPLCHSLTVGPEANCFTAGGLASSSTE